MALAYITCRDKKEAKKIARHLLEKRLIACANILPISSMFWWEEKIAEENEVALLAKTLDFEAVKKAVEGIHSYAVPCILKIDATGSEKYMGWVRKETTLPNQRA
ncbi:TPA: divalent-cation tolerance protein CutA [Candidatus Woesearchaeota archaeon]|nr:divalent-cation tolerance protein CutA [Candidatus Woesearchaeota archaeon]